MGIVRTRLNRAAATAALVVLLAAPAAPTAPLRGEVAAGARTGVVLRQPAHHGTVVVFRGRARPRTAVHLQVRRHQRWATVAVRRSSFSGRFSITLPAPPRTRLFRAVADGQASRSRRVPGPPPPGPVDACGPRPQRADGSFYACTFRDDFDGTALDRSRWMAQDTAKTGVPAGLDGCYVDSDRTIAVAEGTLRLTATMTDEEFLCASPYGPFLTRSEVATVATRSRFTQTYGRFSARVRFSGDTGTHAAFWLYPQAHTYGRWPHSGEIDVAEWWGNLPANVYPSVHYYGEDTQQSSGRDCPMPGASSGFHTYTVEWTPTVMRFFYDDRFCWSHSWTPSDLAPPAPFDQPFYVVLTQIWGLGWAGPTSTSPPTSTFVVDWVRAWQ